MRDGGPAHPRSGTEKVSPPKPELQSPCPSVWAEVTPAWECKSPLRSSYRGRGPGPAPTTCPGTGLCPPRQWEARTDTPFTYVTFK